jgi:hypothetical protein
MKEFFNGWRRKAGCSLLLVACVFTTGWIRSQRRFDLLFIPVGNATYGFVSGAGAIDFLRFWEPESQDELYFLSGDLMSENGSWLDETGYINPWSSSHQIKWRLDWHGFRVGVSHIGNRHDTDCVLPYWSIAIPLTLISAYLILWKPRKRA